MWLLLLMLIFCSGLVDCDDPKCYDELGCFPTDSPWSGPLRQLFPAPESPQKINTQIFCYTRDSSVKYNVILWPQIHLEGCPFIADRTTMILTHGFANSAETSWLAALKDNYLDATDANVFIVDWEEGARLVNYLRAASNTRVVGAEIARFIRFLQNEYGLKASDLHLIGHSLGAQIMSYAAKSTLGTGRITGLDPAQPGYESCDKIVRLDKTDANFVDVIHTNGLPFVPNIGLGYIRPNGHVDFYINGGGRQPFCEKSNLKTRITSMKELSKFTVEAIESLFACSHNRAPKYFLDSLLHNCTLWGHRATFKSSLINADSMGILDSFLDDSADCNADTCIPMGLNTPDYKARGVFAVQTPLVAPFCDDPETNEKILSQISQSSSKKHQKLVGSGNKFSKKMFNVRILK